MYDYITAILIGAAIPLITLWLNSREKRKYFELERKEKLKLVAIEKRLEVHQHALLQWSILQSVIHSPANDEKFGIISRVNEFWLNNCLYMEKVTRKKFKEAIGIVSSYKMWLDMYREMEQGKEKEDFKKFFLKNWEEFHKLFEITQSEVELEPLQPEEVKTHEGGPVNKNIGKHD